MINLNDPTIPIIGAKPEMSDGQKMASIMEALGLLLSLVKEMQPYVEQHAAATRGLMAAMDSGDCPTTNYDELSNALAGSEGIIARINDFFGDEG